MLTRLSDGETKRTATDGRSWSHEAVEALLQLLMKMRLDVSIMTPQGDGSYWCDLASLYDPVKRGRSTQVNVSPRESHIGILSNAYWERHVADNDVVLGLGLMDIYSPRDPIINTRIKLSPQTLVEVKLADWMSPRRFTKDEIAEAARAINDSEAAWSSPGPYWPPAATPEPAHSAPWSPAVASALSSGIGAKTVEGGMVPPSVKVPPAEPKPKKKWWKRK